MNAAVLENTAFWAPHARADERTCARRPGIHRETESVSPKIQSGYSHLSKIVLFTLFTLEQASKPDAGGEAPAEGRGKTLMLVSFASSHGTFFLAQKLRFN